MDRKNLIPIALSFKQLPPQSVDAGAPLAFSILPKWPLGVGPGGGAYVLRDGERVLYSGDLPWSEADDGSIAFAVDAPDDVGEHRLVLNVSVENEQHERAVGVLSFALKTLPHETSLAVWDNPSPVVRGTKFAVKVGAKCTSSCALSDKTVEIRDTADKILGTGSLGPSVWAGTKSLYWTDVSVKAPRKLGPHSWSVRFAPSELKLAHGDSQARFSFVVVAEPEHSVLVKVVNKKTNAPIADAQVRLGLYRTVTDEAGAARLSVPKGKFSLIVTRAGFEMPERTLQVGKDVRVRVGAEPLPEEDPFAIYTA
jgi:carboxypeptidase family protein